MAAYSYMKVDTCILNVPLRLLPLRPSTKAVAGRVGKTEGTAPHNARIPPVPRRGHLPINSRVLVGKCYAAAQLRDSRSLDGPQLIHIFQDAVEPGPCCPNFLEALMHSMEVVRTHPLFLETHLHESLRLGHLSEEEQKRMQEEDPHGLDYSYTSITLFKSLAEGQQASQLWEDASQVTDAWEIVLGERMRHEPLVCSVAGLIQPDGQPSVGHYAGVDPSSHLVVLASLAQPVPTSAANWREWTNAGDVERLPGFQSMGLYRRDIGGSGRVQYVARIILDKEPLYASQEQQASLVEAATQALQGANQGCTVVHADAFRVLFRINNDSPPVGVLMAMAAKKDEEAAQAETLTLAERLADAE